MPLCPAVLPICLILVETRVDSSNIATLLSKLGFTNFVCWEAASYAGGIWVLWQASRIMIEQINVDDQIVYMFVT